MAFGRVPTAPASRRRAMSSSDQDLDRLDELLSALPQENLPMSLSELDGYVTGILSCPDLIPPSEWLPHVWGETGHAGFPDLTTADATISAVMAHYNAVAAEMTRTPWIEPIYEVDPNSDETLWEPWVDGFTRAMRLRPEAWEKVLERADEETRSSLIFLLALQDVYEGTSAFTEEEIDEIDLEAPDMIRNCIAAILLASRPALVMKAENRSRASIPHKHPGRNERCPCGSGRKYKQCCGKN
ncbi:UPF0149 family protein [Defluviimonas salinarum]|uniref:UPF0149 family protein n=1 Tax=Defluviimonas salinarum TaxID=2992147 RepID=A0ABT3JA67_9RHOB|nr:UPF0149 family protein [Defluviimonas salinarum]MCW3784588.1 UPF0149 family protein [Defluviimonas salinarum]